jgi:predicted permease
MKKQNPAVIYGLIGAAALILLGLGMQMYIMSIMEKAVASGESFSPMKFLGFTIISFLVIIAVFIICVVKAIKDYRKQTPDYTFKKLAGHGLLATLIIAVVSTAFSLLYSQVIDPGARQKSIDLTEKVFDNMTGMTEEQKEKQIEQMKNQDPIRQSINGLGLTLLFGVIVSLISASVLNKKATEFSSNPNNLS